MSHCRPHPHPALARAKRVAALLQAFGLCVVLTAGGVGICSREHMSHTPHTFIHRLTGRSTPRQLVTVVTVQLKEEEVGSSILPLPKICDFCVSCMFYGTFIIENVSESAAATC